jgi:hypothetical protein
MQKIYMPILQRVIQFLLGKPRNPLNPNAQRHIALVAFLEILTLAAYAAWFPMIVTFSTNGFVPCTSLNLNPGKFTIQSFLGI